MTLQSNFEQLCSGEGLIAAYVATLDGRILIRAGNFLDESINCLKMAPEGFTPALPLTASEISETLIYLNGKLLPQISSIGHAYIFCMKFEDQFFGAAALTTTEDVHHVYQKSKRVNAAFDKFVSAHRTELTAPSSGPATPAVEG